MQQTQQTKQTVDKVVEMTVGDFNKTNSIDAQLELLSDPDETPFQIETINQLLKDISQIRSQNIQSIPSNKTLTLVKTGDEQIYTPGLNLNVKSPRIVKFKRPSHQIEVSPKEVKTPAAAVLPKPILVKSVPDELLFKIEKLMTALKQKEKRIQDMSVMIQNLRGDNTMLMRQQFQEKNSVLKVSELTLHLSEANKQIETLKEDLIKSKRIVQQ